MALLPPSFPLVGETACPVLWVPAWLHQLMVDRSTRAHLLSLAQHPEGSRRWMPTSTQTSKNSRQALPSLHRPPSPFVGGCV